MTGRWARLYPASWRARYQNEMTEVLAEVPWSPLAMFDLLRGAADAWANPEEREKTPGSAPWLASWATAVSLVALAFQVYRTISIPVLVPVGMFGWWWIPVVAKSALAALLLLFGVWLGWRERWRAAALALTLGTGVSILAEIWNSGPFGPPLPVSLVGTTIRLSPAWTWPAFSFLLQFLVTALAIGICVTAAIRTSPDDAGGASPASMYR